MFSIHEACDLASATPAGCGAILKGLFSSTIPWAQVYAWVMAHIPQIEQAVKDVAAGANLQTIIADLLAMIQAKP